MSDFVLFCFVNNPHNHSLRYVSMLHEGKSRLWEVKWLKLIIIIASIHTQVCSIPKPVLFPSPRPSYCVLNTDAMLPDRSLASKDTTITVSVPVFYLEGRQRNQWTFILQDCAPSIWRLTVSSIQHSLTQSSSFSFPSTHPSFLLCEGLQF